MKRTTLLSILLIGAVAGAADAETRNVSRDGYGTIQEAINASENGDVVVVSPGVYFERINFRGKDITVTSTDPDDPRVVGYTVLNADGEGSAVVFPGGETTSAVLTGFTITGGYGTLNTEEGSSSEQLFMGAGVYCYRSSPTITKNVIVRNEAPLEITADYTQFHYSYGGGIGVWYGSPTITHNTIRNNGAYAGGGILCLYAMPIVHDNMVYENSAHIGGGLVTFAGDIYNNTFVRNDSDYASDFQVDGLGTSLGGNLYILFDTEFGQTRMFNNIIAEAPSGGGFFWLGDPTLGVIAFNNVWNNSPDGYGTAGENIIYGGEADLTGLNGNISEDPLFLASMSRNFHLTLESPCINAGDPDFVPPTGAIDIDGEDRIYAARIDIGADEYVGYVKPVAVAGLDVHVLEPLETVTLDGCDSFFYDADDIQSYQWTQVSGPDVALEAANSAMPTFSPPEAGEYVFELVVADSQYSSESDQVLVFVGPNQRPLADAGSAKAWQTPGQVTLNGTRSYDPDPVDHLTYIWTQIEGPAVTLENATTATPTFAGEPGHVYVFELVVTDGFEESLPSQVRLITVGGTAAVSTLSITPVEDRYPHYVDVSGSRVVFAADSLSDYSWRIAYSDFRTEQTEVFGPSGTNLHPKIEGDVVVWTGDIRFTNNVLVPECASILAYNLAAGEQVTLQAESDTESFSHPAISGNRVVWVRHTDINKNMSSQWYDMPYDICGADISDLSNPTYFTVATNVGRRDPLPLDDLYYDYEDVVDIDGDIVVWEGDGDIYAADISDLSAIRVFTVCDHEGRQYDPSVSGSYVVWTDERNGNADIYGADLSDLEQIEVFEVAKAYGDQRQPTVENGMVAFVQGGTSSGEMALACITRQYGVLDVDLDGFGYGLGPAFDGTTLVWLNGSHGPVQGTRVAFGYSISDGAIENVTTGQRYDYIQHAISDAKAGSEIVVPEGVYHEEISFVGKAITVRSADPTDPAVVAATVLQGSGDLVTFAEEETAESVLDGLTIAGSSRGICCSGGSPTIQRCTITANRGAGAHMVNRSTPTFTQCEIVSNGGAGTQVWVPSDRRTNRPSSPILQNCLIAGNGGAAMQGGKATLNNCTVADNIGGGIFSVNPTITNSIVYFNGGDDGIQVSSDGATITYSNVQGGWAGEGNLDADPLFVAPGGWVDDVWVTGDYHLQSQGYRWDAQTGQWSSDANTSPCIDAGDPAAALLNEPTSISGDEPVGNERINMGAYGGTGQASIAPVAN